MVKVPQNILYLLEVIEIKEEKLWRNNNTGLRGNNENKEMTEEGC